ncbi:efflux RND transporter periplasmic adaptor subunit [Embleya hyalina]|uniref:RND transporter n=1 Tax=Embleya hyalina TaxID=516124 RepID=A0A401YVV9_9ACTN|nr:HlyD family efflux transporter periplasmic adaptor subunit [Embleya hyalina]GCD98709.1 RND transporter [Embleya hyalina]
MRRVRLRRKSVLLNLTLAAALVTGAGFAYAAVDDGGGSTRTGRARTGKVTKGTVMATVSASGSLSSPSDTGVAFTAAGKVTAVAVKVGDRVTAGQVLARIDPAQAGEALDAAKSAVTVAQANLTKARAGTPVQSGGGNGGGSNGGGSGNQGSGNQSSGIENTAVRSGGTASRDVPAATPTTAPPGSASTPVAQPHPTVTVTVTKTATATPSPSTTVDAAAVTQAESALVTANNKVADAQRVLDGCTLIAPSDGVVASVSGKVGDSVSAGGSGGTGASTGSSGSSGSSGSGGSGGQGGSSASSNSTASGFVVLANPTGMESRVSFSEADAAKVKAGQPATVTLNVDSAIRLNAKVVSVNPLPDSGGSAGSVKYGATIALQGDVSTLRTGQTANISVIVAQADNALQVPSGAVTGGTSGSAGTGGSGASVRVLVDGVEQRRTVTLGVVGDQTTQILSGLAEGDEIVIGTVAATGSTSGRSGQSTRGGGTGGGVPGGGGVFPGGGNGGATGGGFPRGGSR